MCVVSTGATVEVCRYPSNLNPGAQESSQLHASFIYFLFFFVINASTEDKHVWNRCTEQLFLHICYRWLQYFKHQCETRKSVWDYQSVCRASQHEAIKRKYPVLPKWWLWYAMASGLMNCFWIRQPAIFISVRNVGCTYSSVTWTKMQYLKINMMVYAIQ